MPMSTPWGPAQSQYKVTEGVYVVTTASHGGVLVGQSVAEQLLSPQAIARGSVWRRQLAYEEDCHWAFFAYEQPALFVAVWRKQRTNSTMTVERMKEIARESLVRWNPDYLRERGETVEQNIGDEEVE